MPYSMGTTLYPYDTVLNNHIFPLAPPNRRRDRPMQVLCLGLPRSGTDSLRHALEILGYSNVYHGWNITGYQREDCVFWIPFLKSKFAKGGYDAVSYLPELANAEVFDKVLGDCEALTDVPAIHFGDELMDAYPDAKVILNRRRDLDKWHDSMKNTMLPMFGHYYSCLRWFDTDFFWMYRNFYLCVFPWVKWDFEGLGRDAAMAHYENLEMRLKKERREWLDWTVEDGWEPLCHFLGKEVPTEPFPNLNAGNDGYMKNMNERIEATVNLALSRAVVAIGVGAVGVMIAVWKLRK